MIPESLARNQHSREVCRKYGPQWPRGPQACIPVTLGTLRSHSECQFCHLEDGKDKVPSLVSRGQL